MVETLKNNPETENLMEFQKDLNDLKKDVESNNWDLNVYENLKDFNFNSILDFSKEWIKFKKDAKKHDEKWDYLELNGKKFYDTAQFQDKVPDDWYVYYMSKNLLYLSEIKNWKYFWDWLQINRDKDITRIKQVY